MEEQPQAPATAAPSATPVAEPKSKMSKKQIIGMTILTIVAVAGVAFGVFGMVDSSSKNSEIAEYKSKIALLEQETGAKIVEQEDTTTEISDTPNIASSEDYIYIGEWGIKIRIPDNLSEVSYIYDNSYFGSLCLTGAKYDGQQYGPEFLDINKNRLGCLSRIATYQNTIGEREYSEDLAVYKSGDYYWVYQGPQAIFSVDENEAEWEAASVSLIKEMLETPSNYTDI